MTLPLGVRTYGLSELAQTDSVLRLEGSGMGADSDSVMYFAAFTHLSYAFDSALYFDAIHDTLIKPQGMQDTTDWFDLDEQQHRLFIGRIDSGSVSISVHNPDSDEGDTATVVLADVIDRFGDSLVVSMYVPGRGIADTTIDLATYRIFLDDETPQKTKARLISAPEARIIADVQTSRIYFDYFDGEIHNLRLDSLTSGITVDSPPEGWESVHPTQVDLYLHLTHGVTATADVSAGFQTYDGGAVLSGTNHNFEDVYLGRDTTVAVVPLMTFTQTYPDSVSAGATVTLSGRVATYTDVPIDVLVEMRAPLAFVLDSVHSPGDVIRVDAADLEDVQSGTATIRIWNHLPVEGSAFLVASHDSMAVLENSGANVDTIVNTVIPMAALSHGRPTADAYTEVTIPLTDSVLELLRNPPFFTRTDVNLPGSDGDTLIAYLGDYVKVQVVADIVYHINSEGDE